MSAPLEVRLFVLAMLVVLAVTIPLITVLDWISSALMRRGRRRRK